MENRLPLGVVQKKSFNKISLEVLHQLELLRELLMEERCASRGMSMDEYMFIKSRLMKVIVLRFIICLQKCFVFAEYEGSYLSGEGIWCYGPHS